MKKPIIFTLLVLMLASLFMPAFALAKEHTVNKGETLWSISQKYNISVEQIYKYNKLSSDVISIGQKLKVGETEEKPNGTKEYKVKKGDTLWSIASKNGTTVEKLRKLNNLKTDVLSIGQILKIQNEKNEDKNKDKEDDINKPGNTTLKTYTVKPGDTLYKIQRETGVTVAEIMKLNNLKSDLLSIGQKLKLTEENKTLEMVTTSDLNLREKATTNSKIITTMPKGEIVKVGNLTGDWYEVNYEKYKGYAHKDYLIENSGHQDTKVEYAKVTATGLYLRKGPSTSNENISLMLQGEKVKVLSKNGDWWKVEYNGVVGYASSEFLEIIKDNGVENGKNPIGGRKILVDPGHGGFDPGAVNGSYQEKAITQNVSNYLKNELVSRGYEVVMSKQGVNGTCSNTNSTSVELQCRVNLANNNNVDMYISIHANSAVPLAKGTETYYSSNNIQSSKSKQLAEIVHKNYQPTFNSSDRGVKVNNFYVNRYAKMPSILLELGFITNPDDLSKLTNSSMQRNLAVSIANGIDEYASKN